MYDMPFVCLQVLGLESLERRRLIDLVLCYKIIHSHSAAPLLLQLYIKCQSKTVLLMPLNTFSNRVIDVWNSLPDFIVAASSLNGFKKRLHSANLSKFSTIV